MKFFLVLCVFVALCSAEPPRFKSARLRSRFFARQEEAPAAEDTTSSADSAPYPPAEAPYPPAEAPYPPSGWKPEGEPFELPTETTTASPLATAYGAPADTYGAPADAYGPPKTSYGVPVSSDDGADTGEGVTADSEVETATQPPAATARFTKLKSQRLVQRRPQSGNYYVLLPDNTLQRIVVGPNGARVNTAFNAKLLQEVPRPGRTTRF